MNASILSLSGALLFPVFGGRSFWLFALVIVFSLVGVAVVEKIFTRDLNKIAGD